MSDPPPSKRRRDENEVTALQDELQSTEDDKVAFVYTGQPIPRNITDLSVDPSVRRIEDQAFEDYFQLCSVSIPPAVEEIGKQAFKLCFSLVDVRLHQGLKSIGTEAFAECNALVDIDLPTGLTAIGDSTFSECQSLLTVRMPTTVETIGNAAFCNCKSLVNIRLHEGLKRIGKEVFRNCKALLDIEIPQGINAIKTRSFYGCRSLRTISMPNTVEMIGDCALYGCVSLVDAQLGSGVKRIGCEAFDKCRALSAIALPLSLEVLEERAFRGCKNLRGIEFLSAGINIRSASDCFENCTDLVNAVLPVEYVGYGSLADNTFSGCHFLQDLFEDGSDWLRGRFSNLPIHNACYESAITRVDELNRILDDSSSDLLDDSLLIDAFEMTPFHILATSASLRLDLLECLLDSYPMDILGFKDKNENTMMDYLLIHSSSRAVPLLQMVLNTAVVNRISTWHPRGNWGSHLFLLAEKIPWNGDLEGRREHTRDFLSPVGDYTRVEMTSLLELAVWKMKMNSERVEETPSNSVGRESCRCQSGAGVVIENVFGFLWDEEEDWIDTALSLFPLCSYESIC